MKTRSIGVIATLAGLSLLHTAAAHTVWQEPFDYPDGPVIGAPGSPWFAHSSAGDGPVTIDAGRMDLRFDQAEDISALLPGAPYETNGATAALYVGFTLRVTELPTMRGAYVFHLRNATTQHRARLWISRTNAAQGHFRLGVGNSSGASATSGPWPVDLAPAADHQVVLRYQLATGLSTLWVNPTAESDSGVTATDTPGLMVVQHVSLRQSADIGVMSLDDLRVGDTFADAMAGGVRVALRRQGPMLELSWPSSEEGYSLESTQDLMAPDWQSYQATAAIETGRYVVRVPNPSGQRFFRLVKEDTGTP